jgi:hypothetical protein
MGPLGVAFAEALKDFTPEELNTPKMYEAQRVATEAFLASQGWTLEEWRAETARRLVEAREAMHARIARMKETEQ